MITMVVDDKVLEREAVPAAGEELGEVGHEIGVHARTLGFECICGEEGAMVRVDLFSPSGE